MKSTSWTEANCPNQRKKYKERKKNPKLSLRQVKVFFADRRGNGRISSLLLLGHGLRLSRLGFLRLKSGLLTFAFVLWLGSALASLLTLGHLYLPTLVTSLTRLFGGLGRGKKGLGRRRLLSHS